MAIEFECPECETTIRVKDSAAGKTGRCPKCRVLLMVPDPDDWDDEELEGEAEEAANSDTADEQEDAATEPEAASGEETTSPHFPEMAEPPVISEIPVIATESSPAEPELSPSPVAESTESPPTSVPSTPLKQPSIPAPSPEPEAAPPTAAGQASPAAGDGPNIGFPLEAGFGSTESVSASVLRGRSSKTRRPPMPMKQKVTILSAVGGIALVLAVGFWFYLGTLPDLTGPLAGERLARASFAEISIRVPDDISGETAEFVATELRAQPLTMKSEFLEVVIYPGKTRELDAAIAAGTRTVAVRVPLASHPEIRKAMTGIEGRIIKQKDAELQRATSTLVNAYASHLRDKTPMSHLHQLRDGVALNASVSAVGYSLVATVGSTPFRCAYEDSEGYCYFFVPANTRTFRINGRRVFGENQEPPLPADFEVTLTDVDTAVSVSQSGDSKGESTSNNENSSDNNATEDAEKKSKTDAAPKASDKPPESEKPENEENAAEPSET